MVIDNNNEFDRQGIKYLFNENLKGRILFLRIVSTNTFIMRYTGREDLFLNGQNIFPGQTYVFDHGSSIRGSLINAIYYNDISGVFTDEAFKLKISIDATGYQPEVQRQRKRTAKAQPVTRNRENWWVSWAAAAWANRPCLMSSTG